MTRLATLPKPNRFRCPQCAAANTLWRGVQIIDAWQEVDEHLTPQGKPETDFGPADYEPDGTWGCSKCEWEGRKEDLVEIGWDDKPLPRVRKGQLTIGHLTMLNISEAA